jgi:hypothetical protein
MSAASCATRDTPQLKAARVENLKYTRLNMRTNLKVILSAVGVAALLASPAMAKTVRHHHVTPSTIYIPNDARGSVAPYGYGSFEGGPYTPSIPTPAHGLNRDFQDGSRG